MTTESLLAALAFMSELQIAYFFSVGKVKVLDEREKKLRRF